MAQEVCCNGWVCRVQMGALSLPKPPALELHCSAANPANHLLHDQVPNACSENSCCCQQATLSTTAIRGILLTTHYSGCQAQIKRRDKRVSKGE